MEKVKMRDCGDGYRRADAGSFSPSVAKTAAYTILASDAGKLFTNRGATAAVTFTLPTAKEGMFFRFAEIAGYDITVNFLIGATLIRAYHPGITTVYTDGTSWFSDVSERELYADVTLTNANIKNCRATPITLVAAQGNGKILEFVRAELYLDYGSNVLTESTYNLAIKYTNGSGVAVSQTIEATGFIDAAADTMTNALPKIDQIIAVATPANAALVLHNTGGGEYAGNAGVDTTMKVRTWYQVRKSLV